MSRRKDPSFALLLKAMQNVNDACQPHGINRTVGVAVMVLHNLKNSRAFEPFQRFGRFRLHTSLGETQRIAHRTPYWLGQGKQLFESASDPFKRIMRWRRQVDQDKNMPELGIAFNSTCLSIKAAYELWPYSKAPHSPPHPHRCAKRSRPRSRRALASRDPWARRGTGARRRSATDQ